MIGYLLLLNGETLAAVVVGGGAVAARKARALLESGAAVRLVAPAVGRELRDLAATSQRLEIVRARYEPSLLGAAMLVVAATDDDATNAAVAADARSLGRLVNVASAPELGNCVTPAVHRAGEVVVAINSGGVPGAAARMRDALARRFDDRYASAVQTLSTLRRSLLESGRRDRWTAAAESLLGEDFCELVESGELDARAAAWR